MLSFDSETALIREACLAPPLACITYSDGENSEIVHWNEGGYRASRWLLEQPKLTSANGPYDMAVLWAQYPDLRDQIWDFIGSGRLHDVQTRQKLQDIGAGCYRKVFRRVNGSEKVQPLHYSLSHLHARYFGTFMEKDEWRLRYGELRELPLAAWPKGARDYATYDAVATSRVHILQDQYAQQNEKHNLWDESNQVRAHFALHLMSCWGFATDRKQVERVIGQIDSEQPALAKRLMGESLIRAEGGRYVRSEKLAKARMYAAVGDAGELTETGYKKVKEGKFNKDEALRNGYIQITEEWCEVSKDPGLIDYCRFRQNQLLRSKLENVFMAAASGLPIQTSFECLMETGRTSSSENKLIQNSMALQNPPRKPILTKNAKGEDVPALGADGRPIGGMRECFIARPGYTIIACDYGQAELVALSQVTYSAFGYSKMKDLLNAGKDIHIDFGKEVLAVWKGVHISYEEAWANKKRADIKEFRQIAKCFHGHTEVLTRTGWVRMCDLKNGVEIAAACFSDGGNTHIKWETPTRLTTRVAEELVHLQNENVDLWVTPDHRMAAWSNKEIAPLQQTRDPKTGRMVAQGGRQRKKHLVAEVCTPEELGSKRAWPSAGLCEEGSIEVPEQLLRLAVAVQADGNYEKDQEGVPNGRVRFGFTKTRKINRLRALLGNIEHTQGLSSADKPVTTFSLTRAASAPIRALLDPDKTLPWAWLKLTRRCREIVLDEARHWDSHIPPRGRNNFHYTTTLTKNADVLQAIASITGKKASIRVEHDGEHAPCSKLSVKDRANTRGGNLETTRHAWNSDVYCVTVPSGAVLVRYNGKTTVTFQCADFGFPGGLGWASFQSYARKAWGVELTGEQAKQLKIFWLRHFPEMKDYFRWMSNMLEAGGGRADIQSLFSNRWRGKCFYTQGCNNMFQSLTADAAKAALWEVSRLCYTVKSSQLYGCRPLLFVHDELLVEAPLAQAAAAAKELERVMIEVYQRYTPDVKITADAHLMQAWSKDAEAAFDEYGRLVPWEPPQSEDEKAEFQLLLAA